MTLELAAPPERLNFAQYLFQLNRQRGGKVAYVDDSGTLSYRDLQEQSRRFASAMLALGVHPGERVLLAMLDCKEWAVAFLGCLYAGVVPVCVNTVLPPSEHAYMLQHSGARAVITSDVLAEKLGQAVALLDPARQGIPTVVVGQAAGAALAYADFVRAEPLAAPADTSMDDIAFWLYSSGSTGRPKGTVHTHGNAYWTIETYARHVLQLREDDVVFSAAKFFFAYGLGNALSFPLAAGATVVVMAERPTAQAVFKRLVEHQVTVFYGVPTLFANMLADPELPQRAATAMRKCTSAGEPLPESLGQHFSRHFGCDILDGIGSTEMLHIFLSNRDGDVRYGTTGKPVPGYELSLRDEAGEEVPAGEIGDLYIKGPSSALMYWTDRKRSQATFQGVWTKSGDKYVVEDGYYRYCGRSDDMIKVSGQYVSPAEVESVLVSHASVLEAAVVEVADANGLTRCKGFVVLKPGIQGTPEHEQALRAFVKTKLAPHKAPQSIEFVGELPKTATGKIQRFRLRQREAAAA